MTKKSKSITEYLPRSLASKLRDLKEEGRKYSLGVDDQGNDPVRDAILDQDTSVDDIAYFVEVIISMYDTQRKRIERGLESCLEGDYIESKRIFLGTITGAFEAKDISQEKAPCHILSRLDFTVEAAYFKLGILQTNGSTSASFIEQSLRRARETYDEAINRAYTFQKEQLTLLSA